MTNTMQIWIGNLGKYNEGELIGEWLELPASEDELHELFERIGLGQFDEDGEYTHGRIERDEQGNEYHYEEWSINDWENIPFEVNIYSNVYQILEKAQEWADLTEDLSSDDLEIIEAVNDYDSYYGIEKLIEMWNDGELRVWSGCKDMSDVAYELVQETGMLSDCPENLQFYFNYEAFGRDLDIEGTFIQVNYDTIVEVCR